MIEFGSIGKAMLHLLERHFEFDRSRFVVIEPKDADRALLDAIAFALPHAAVTRYRYRDLLTNEVASIANVAVLPSSDSGLNTRLAVTSVATMKRHDHVIPLSIRAPRCFPLPITSRGGCPLSRRRSDGFIPSVVARQTS